VNKLYIQTQQEILDAPWFSYTLNLLSSLAGLVSLPEAGTDSAPAADMPTLYYGVTPPDGAHPLLMPSKPSIGRAKTTLHQLDCAQAGLVQVPIYSDTMDDCTGGIDLLFNLFAYVSCLEEYEHEIQHGPIHSYAFRLKSDHTQFKRPFAHYIGLAFRTLIEGYHPQCLAPLQLQSTIYLTHDVDVIQKTMRTRLKESVFRIYANIRSASFAPKWVLQMLLGADDYFLCDKIAQLEEHHGVRSCFNVYAKPRPNNIFKRFRALIFDPSYDIENEDRLIKVMRDLNGRGFEIGIHFAFDSWNNPQRMMDEKKRLEACLNIPSLGSCRQHWLRFSLGDTWAAQEKSGIQIDTTLCFNDVSGFRAGMAIPFYPYDHESQCAHSILAVPTIAMDTHFFYYKSTSQDHRREKIRQLVIDVKTVGGAAAMIWHSHVFSHDHGWGNDYEFLLSLMRELNVKSGLPSQSLVQKKHPL